MIEIVGKPEKHDFEGIAYWQCDLWITQDSITRHLPATAPNELQEVELQDYFEAQEDHLWSVAEQKQYAFDICENIASKRVLKAFVSVVMDEINILRDQHDLPARTKQQLIQAIKAKLKE